MALDHGDILYDDLGEGDNSVHHVRSAAGEYTSKRPKQAEIESWVYGSGGNIENVSAKSYP